MSAGLTVIIVGNARTAYISSVPRLAFAILTQLPVRAYSRKFKLGEQTLFFSNHNVFPGQSCVIDVAPLNPDNSATLLAESIAAKFPLRSAEFWCCDSYRLHCEPLPTDEKNSQYNDLN